MKKIRIIMLAAVTALSTLTACGGGTQTGGTGNEITLAITTDQENMDATRGGSVDKSAIVMEVQETLVRYNGEGELVPSGAKEWTVSEDGTVWTFTLNDNKYADGADVTAQDYVNCVMRTLDPAIASNASDQFFVITGAKAYTDGSGGPESVGIRAVDDKTLEITLEYPIPYFLQTVNSCNLTPIPAEDIEGDKNENYGSDFTQMSFSGPFMIKEWKRGSEVILEKNPNYWDKDSVKLDRINMVLVQEMNTRQQMFEQGELHLLQDCQEEFLNKMKASIEDGTYVFTEDRKTSLGYICFNNEDPEGIFINKKIRQAFALAVDREIWVKEMSTTHEAAYGMIAPATHCGDKVFRDEIEEPLKAMLGQDAKQLYEEGLKEIGKEGQDVTVRFLQKNSEALTKSQAEYLQNQWESKLGVNVEIDMAADSSTFFSMVGKGQYQVCLTGWGAGVDDPISFVEMHLSDNANNFPKYKNERYDELVTACLTEMDQEVRIQKFAEAEAMIVEDASVAPMGYGIWKNLAKKELKGVVFNGAGGPNIELKWAYLE